LTPTLVLLGALLTASVSPDRPDVIVIIADDVGEFDVANVATPNLDRLRAASVDFPRAYTSASMCSPSRTALTGLYPNRLGIGRIVQKSEANDLKLGADTIAARLRSKGYASCHVGKWHLSSGLNYPAEDGPGLFGFDAWRATATHNLQATLVGGGFFQWTRVDDGVAAVTTEYATTAQVDAAIQWWNGTNGPKFLWLAFSAAHNPYHVPPAALTGGLAPTDNRGMFEAAIVAMDTEIGRLRASIQGEPFVFFWSDNGTPSDAVAPVQDPTKVKRSMYDGGVGTPFYVSGPGVTPTSSRRLVSSIDIYATVLDLARIHGAPNDSFSFADVLGGRSSTAPRRYAFAERFTPNFDPLNPPATLTSRERMATDGVWKLMVEEDGGLENFRALFHLPSDPTESNPLPNPAKEAELQLVLDAIG
jgi:arylsulfatase A-like enzyme